MKTDEIQTTLLNMARLLRIGSSLDWSSTYEDFAQKIVVNPEDTARRILASYGGMGSLNDVVLQINGEMLRNENEEFDAMRSRLYLLCTQLIRAT